VSSEVVVCVRPSALRLSSSSADGENVAHGRVVQQAYLGDQQDVRIELVGGLLVRALVPSRQQHEPGSEVVVQFSPSDCHIVAN
jgi:iron(III) transport system ATP-binding protein